MMWLFSDRFRILFLYCLVTVFYRIIKTIDKHIVAEDTLPSRNEGISIDESTYFWIVITGLEIIQFGLFQLC